MKNSLLILMLLMSIAVMAQNDSQKRKAAFFADAAAKKFDLNKEQRELVYQSKLVFFADRKRIKDEGLEGEEKKEALRAGNKADFQVLRKVTGLQPKDLLEWNKATMKEMYKVK